VTPALQEGAASLMGMPAAMGAAAMRLGRPHREALSFLFATANVCVWSREGSRVDTGEHTEKVEKEISRMIEKRSRKGEADPDEREELWKQGVRAYTARREEKLREAWCEHHQGQAARLRATLEALIARHKAEAARLAP
jgi:hypothetical protein